MLNANWKIVFQDGLTVYSYPFNLRECLALFLRVSFNKEPTLRKQDVENAMFYFFC